MNVKRVAIVVALAVVLGSVAAPGALAAQDGAGAGDVECEYPVTMTDATGDEVTVEERPDRIVTLQPSSTQIAWEIGVQDRVVGAPVGEYIDYLEGYDEPEDVSMEDNLTPSTERIVALEPDLVIASGVQDQDQVEQLRDANVTVVQFETPDSIDQLYEEIRLTGAMTDECEGAEETVSWMQTEIEVAQEAAEGQDRPLVFYSMGSGFTAGNGTFTDEIITAAGGENLGTEVGIEDYDVVSEETVAEEDPEWIVYPDSFDEPPVREEVVQSTSAWQNDRIVAVNDNYMNQPGPRIVSPIQRLAEEFHPEAYAEAREELTDGGTQDGAEGDGSDGTETTGGDDGTAEDGEEGTTVEGDETESTAESDGEPAEETPGFGITAGIVGALLASLLVARRSG